MKIKILESYDNSITYKDIKGITLLSVDEYNSTRIPHMFGEDGSWWLRTKGPLSYEACVEYRDDGYWTSLSSYIVSTGNVGVRPALIIDSSTYLDTYDKIALFYHEWTVLDCKYKGYYMALCDDFIFRSCFNKSDRDGNDYETSYIKERLEKWLEHQL